MDKSTNNFKLWRSKDPTRRMLEETIELLDNAIVQEPISPAGGESATSPTTGAGDRNGVVLSPSPNEMRPFSMIDGGCHVQTISEERQRELNESIRVSLNLEESSKVYFPDGSKNIVDYVLVYEQDDRLDTDASSVVSTPRGHVETCLRRSLWCCCDQKEGPHDHNIPCSARVQKRRVFEQNLLKLGLKLYHIKAEPPSTTHYLLVHAPFPVLEKQAELLSVKLPVKQSDIQVRDRTLLPGAMDRWLAGLHVLEWATEADSFLSEPDFFMAPYSLDRRHTFLNANNPAQLFPNAERSRMVYDLLSRAHYGLASTIASTQGQNAVSGVSAARQRASAFQIGIDRLIENGSYSAAFPLHNRLRRRGDFNGPPPIQEQSQRELLYYYWASWRNFYKYQPLDLIKRYFGSKIGIYFAWLGFYTRYLYLPSILGVIVFLYGLITMFNDQASSEVCEATNTMVCPQCVNCQTQSLDKSCLYAKLSFLCDNIATVLYAGFMSIWATLFLEGWKRYHAEVAWKWGLSDFMLDENNSILPEYQARVKTLRVNPVTRQNEPYLPFRQRLWKYCTSGCTVLFFMLLVLALVVGMMIYRAILLQMMGKQRSLRQYDFLIVTATSGVINLVVILLLNYFYFWVALYLTRWECPRTQTDFDNSFTVKVFLFQFVSFYSPLFYIAFFKGLWGGSTSDLQLEACDASGCFAELVVVMIVIMCGRQFFNSFMEIGYPWVLNAIRRWQLSSPTTTPPKNPTPSHVRARRGGTRVSTTSKVENPDESQPWQTDYLLSPTYDQFLFDEYLEMVIQFGFVTLFVAAFPLAPLFALINNVLEIRLDAYKFLTTMQRPAPMISHDIGIWRTILDAISKISVTTNAFVIAFTSDFIPKTVYRFQHAWSLHGYVNSTLSTITLLNGTTPYHCEYRAYRTPPCELQDGGVCAPNHGEYELTYHWWFLLALRLLFVVVFEHVVFAVQAAVSYLIPDEPQKIFLQQQRERHLARQALLDRATGSARSTSTGLRTTDERGQLATEEPDIISNAKPSERASIAFQPGGFTELDYESGAASGDYPMEVVVDGNYTNREGTVESYDTAPTDLPFADGAQSSSAQPTSSHDPGKHVN